MKDLKHLIYFEGLLENANNPLIEQARSEGKLAVGYTCFHMPEVLLNLDNCFSVRLRAPNKVPWILLHIICPTILVSFAARYWSVPLKEVSTSLTPWRAWTLVRR